MPILIAVCLLVLIVFGVTSGMQSYATAKQAQATIEVAQVAQVNAWGNLVVILLLALVIVCVLALVVYRITSFSRRNPTSVHPKPPTRLPSGAAPILSPSLDTLIELKKLEILDRMFPSASQTVSNEASAALPEGHSAQGEDILNWLRSQ